MPDIKLLVLNKQVSISENKSKEIALREIDIISPTIIGRSIPPYYDDLFQ